MEETTVLKYILDFDEKPAKEKLSSIKEDVVSVGESVKSLTEQKTDTTTGDIVTYGLNNKTEISSVLSEATAMVNAYTRSIKKMGQGLQEVLLSPFSMMSSQIVQFDETLTKFTKKHLTSQDFEKYNNRAAAQAAAISESREYATAALAGMNNSILKNKKVDPNLPFLRNLVVRMIEEETTMNRSTMTLGSAAAFAGKTSQFRDAIKTMSGYKTADDSVYIEAAKALLASSPQARSKFLDTTGHLQRFNFSTKPIYSTNYDALPDNMKDVYMHRGVVEGKISRGHKVRASQEIYQKLIDLADYGENHELVEMARELGLLTIGDHNRAAGQKGRKQKTGQMHWRQEATMDQFDSLAGLTLKKLHEIRYGSPLYPRNPVDNTSHSKVIMELNEILGVLEQEKQLKPGIMKPEDIAHRGEYVQMNKNVDRSIVRSFKRPSLYVIPQTRIGQNGEMVYSDPKTAARTKERTRQGLGDKDTDNFVAINDSLFARLAGFSPVDNNTFGHGSDASGQAIYGKPNVIKISAANLRPTDKFGMPIPTPKGQKVKPTQELLAYTDIMEQGGIYGTGEDQDRYVFAWPAAQGKGAYLMPKTKVDEIKRHYEEDLNMPSPLEGFDSRGPIISGNRERTSKLINNLRKGASPGTPLIEHGFRLPSIKAIDYEAVDKLFEGSGFGEVLKNQIIDGLAYGNPDYIPTSLQGRLWGAPGKFMLQRLSLADLFDKSGAFKNMVYNGTTNLNQLITPNADNGYGYSVWVPSLATRNLEVNKELLKPYGVETVQDLLANMKAGKYDATTAEQIRKSWLTDIMSNPDIMMTDSSVKNEDKFTVLPENMYRGMFGIAPNVQIPASRKDQYGRVLLTAPEAEKYMYNASAATYGPWVMKTNDEFETEKGTMAVSAADAINYPPSMIRMSDKLYKAKLDRYADKAWLREHFLSQDQFAYKLESNPAWLESQEARAIIESEKQAIKADLDSRQKYLITTKNNDVLAQMLPGAGNDRLIKAIGGGDIDPNSEVAQLFPELYTLENLKKWGFDTTQLYDEVGTLRDEFFVERNGKRVLDPTKYMFAPGWNHASAIAGRMPASPGTYGELINLAYQREKDNSKNMFMKAFHAVGNFDTDMAAVTPEGIQRMNTGDFDGDTIWLYAQMADDMLANLEAVNAPMDKAKAAAAKVRNAYDLVAQKQNLPNIYEKYYGDLAKEDNVGQIRASATLNAQGAQLIMGQATAGIRNILTYGDLSDDETARALQALVEYYDLGTSEVMNMGLEPEVQNDLAKKYMMSHRTYNRLMQQITQEESSGEPKIDSLFKYRPGSLSSPRDLAVMEMQAVGRSAYGSDQGLRERVLKAVDRAYTPGTKLHGMADKVANLIVDSETGYRFWPQNEVEQLYSLLPDIKMEAQGDSDKLSEVKRIEDFLTDYIKEGPTLERMQSKASGDGAIAEQAQFLLEHQSKDGEKAVHDQMMQMIQERRQAVLDVAKLQEETAAASGLSAQDLVKLGKIQDTTKLDKFNTSWSVTSVEPFMDNARSKAAMLPFLKEVRSYTLDHPRDGHHTYVGLSALRGVDDLDFGSYSSMAQKEREELLNQNADSFDTVLGTFMHSGFEDFFTRIAKPLAKGEEISLTAQDFTKYLRDKLANGTTTDSEGHAVSWRKMFDNIGINIDDITSAFTQEDSRGNALFGPTIQGLTNSQNARAKLEKIFGIEYGPGPDGKTHRYNGIGLPERLLASWFDEYESNPSQNIKRVVATENKIFNKNGDVVDVSRFADALPIDLPSVFGDRYVHAKPDLVYEGEDGRFHMMDYKSSSKGAVQALYQNAIYAEMLRKLGQASYEGYFEDGRAVPESLKKNLEVYRQFVEKVTSDDPFSNKDVYKNKIDTVQSFDLETGRKNVVKIDEQGIKAVYDEYLNGIRNKAEKLKKGYVEGKMLMFDKGELSEFSANPEQMMQEMQEVEKLANSAEFRDDKNAARREFLVQQFRQDQEAITDARSNLYKYQKQYGLIGKSFSINKFAPLVNAVEGGLSKEAMAAMYAEYEGSPEIQKIIADQIEGKASAKEDLYSVMREAAIKDSAFAKDKLTSLVSGKETSSSAMSLVDIIDKEVATARGSLLALKDKDSWDNTRGWRDTDEKIDLSKLKKETEEEKKTYAAAEEFNKREAQRLSHATQNKAAYEVGELNLNTLLTEVPKLKEKAFESELKHEKNELDNILKDGDPYQDLMNAVDKKETEVADYILAKKLKISQLQQKLDAKDDKGNHIINDVNDRNSIQNLIDTLNSNVSQAENKVGKAGNEVIQQQLEQLGLDAKTSQEKAKEWLDKRQAAIKAKTDQDRQQTIDEYNKAEAEQENIRTNLREKHPDGQITIDELLSQDESARLKQERNKKLNEISALGSSKLSTYNNLGADLQRQIEDQEALRLQQADLLTTGGTLSREDKIKELAARRFESILKIGQALPIEQQDAYWASHRYEDIEKQVRQETNENIDQQWLAQQQKENQLQHQNEMAVEQRRHQYEQMRRGRFGASGSRIGNAYQRQLDQKWNLDRQVKDSEFYEKQLSENIKVQQDAFEAKYKMSYADFQKLTPDEQKAMGSDVIVDAGRISAAQKQMEGYSAAAKEAQAQSDAMSSSSMVLSAAFQGISQSISMVARRLGRQIFMKATQEAKRFVQEFDKSMTTIQMITLKSDEQMSTLGDGLIAKAKELKVSISEITQSAETLYRQGLSDQEVDERLDVISKFSKVSGTKVDAATKLVTVAMNTGLVSNPEVAADIVTALGDNAATNASEIEKGIEKAGAAAAADGTTFAQLASMLTAITSTTQIGGNVAGRTLNTIFGRMNKIGTNEIIVDENGNKVSGSAVAKLLKAQGIETYDKEGNKRSSYDVLYDLSQKWDTMSDAEQQQLATAIAGTRQYSNFAAIMQGMAEGKVDEYMSLTDSSSGIVDEKFDIYTKSLQASLTDLKNAFDELVHDLTDSGALTGFLDFITGMINGVDNLTNSFGGLSAMLATVLPMLAGLMLLKAGVSTANLGLIVGGIAAVAAGGGIASLAGNKNNPDEMLTKNSETYKKEYEEQNTDLKKFHELHTNNNKTSEQNDEYLSLAKNLSVQFGLIDSTASSTITSIEGLTSAIHQMGDTSSDVEEAITKAAEERKKESWAQHFDEQANLFGQGLSNDIEEINEENEKIYNPGNNLFTSFDLWHYDDEAKKYVLNENAVAKQNRLVGSSQWSDAFFGFPGFVAKVNNQLFGMDQDDTSWSKDVKPYLPNLYYTAARRGYIRKEDGSLLDEDQMDLSYWQEKLSSGQITEKEMQGMLDYYNELEGKTGYSQEDRSRDQIKSKLKERLINDLSLDQWMSEDKIDALADLGSKYYNSLENPEENPLAVLDYLFGAGFTTDEKIEHANKLLTDNGYSGTSNINKTNYELEPLGKYDYYVDEDGKTYTEEEANAYIKGLKELDKERAVGIMQAHNQAVIDEYETNKAEVDAENERRKAEVDERNAQKAEEMERLEQEDIANIEKEYQQDLLDEAQRLYYTNNEPNSFELSKAAEEYYKDKWIELHGGNPNNWEYMTPETRQRELAYMQGGGYGIKQFELAPSDIQQKYIQENADWDQLTEAERDQWIERARNNVSRREAIDTTWEPEKATLLEIPELDESKLIGGVNATVEALGQLYDENSEELSKCADEIDEANKQAAEGAKTLTKKTHTFVESLSAYNTGDKSWLTKNQTGVSADNITSLLVSGQFGTGTEGLLNFMNYVEANPEAELDWQYVIANNTDLQNVMRQASYNKNTNTWTGPADIMSQMLHAAQSGSLTYGAATLTTQQKASIAQQAFNGLTAEETPWFISQQAKEAAQDKAYAKYVEEQVAARTEEENAVREKYEEGTPRLEIELDKISKKYAENTLSEEDFVATQTDLMADVMSPEQQQYLKEALGESMYARILEARAGGKALTDEEKTLAQLQLSNRSIGLTSLSSRQQLDWINKNQTRLATLGEENGLSRAVADTYMSQWSGWNEYAALIESQNAGNTKLFNELGGTERLAELTQELENFKESTQIKIDIEGVQALEEAGKVAEGTANSIAKLKGNAHGAAVEMNRLSNEAYSSGQERAKLYNGTIEQQYEAAMAITGMSATEFYKNATDNLAYARNYDRTINQQADANAWLERFKAQKNASGQQAIIAMAKRAGYEWSNETQGFIFNPELLSADFENELLNREITEQQSARMADLSKILRGEMVQTNDNTKQYNAAVGVAGEKALEYLTKKAQSNVGTYTFKEGEEDALLQAALSETTLSERELAEKDALEQARLNATTAGGAYAYGQLQYQQNNKAALAANGIYEALTSGEFKNVAELNEAVGQTQVENWKELLKSAPELANKLEELGARVTDEGIDFSGVKGAGEDLAGVINYITELIGQSGKNLETQTVQTNADILRTAEATLEGRMNRETGMPAIQSILGGDNNVTRKINNYIADSEKNLEQQQREWEAQYSSIPQEYRAEWVATHQRPTFDVSSALTPLESLWAQGKVEAYSRGEQGISAQTQLAGLDLVREQLASGKYGEWATEQDQTALSDITKGYEEYIKNIAEAKAGTEEFDQAMKEFDDAVSEQRANETVKLTKATKGLGETLAGIKKGGSDGVTALNKFRSTLTDYRRSLDLIDKVKGKAGKDIKGKDRSQLAQLLGLPNENDLDMYSADDLEKMLTTKRNDIMDTVAADMQALFDQDLQQALKDNGVDLDKLEIPLEDIEIEVDSAGNVKVNTEGVTADVQAAIQQAVSAFYAQAGPLASMIFKILGFGKGLQLTLEKGNGKVPKSGGGGGGGKSAVDKLLEKQKHTMAGIEHEIKMNEAATDDAARANNMSSFNQLIQERIDLLGKQRDQYVANIAEMEALLKKTKAGTDDYKKLEEAIWAAQEAAASLAKSLEEIAKTKIDEILQQFEVVIEAAQRKQTNTDLWKQWYAKWFAYDAAKQKIGEGREQKQAEIKETAAERDRIIKERDDLVAAGTITVDSDYYRELTKKAEELDNTVMEGILALYDLAKETQALNDQMAKNAAMEPTARMGFADATSKYFKWQGKYGDTEQAMMTGVSGAKALADEAWNTYQRELATQKEMEHGDYTPQERKDQEERTLNALNDYYSKMGDVQDRISALAEMYSQILQETLENLDRKIAVQEAAGEGYGFYNDIGGLIDSTRSANEIRSAKASEIAQFISDTRARKKSYAESYGEGYENTDYYKKLDADEQAQMAAYLGILNEINNSFKVVLSELQQNISNINAPLEHARNIQKFQNEQYERYEDFESYRAGLEADDVYIQGQIYVNKQLISSLKALREETTEGDDAWQEYTRAIEDTEDKILSLAKATQDNRDALFKSIQKQQQLQDEPYSQIYSLIDVTSNSALQQGDYETFDLAAREKYSVLSAELVANQQQRKVWEKELENAQDATEVRRIKNEIIKIETDSAKKESEMISLRLKIAQERLNAITRALKLETATDQHSNKMYEMYGQHYARYSDYNGLRDAYANQMEDTQDMLAYTAVAYNYALAQMNSYDVGTKEWYEARDAVYSYAESCEQLALTLEDLREKTDASYVTEIIQKYSDAAAQMDLQLAAIQANRTIAQQKGDYKRLDELAEQERAIYQQYQQSDLNKIEELKNTLAGSINGSQSWRNARTELINTIKKYYSDQSAEMSAVMQSVQLALDEETRNINWADSEEQHKLNLIQYQQSVYDNHNQLSNQNIMIQKENDVRAANITRLEEQLRRLREMTERYADNADAQNKLTEMIRKTEEQIASETAEIDKNSEAIKENNKKILEARKTLEDMVEKEIKDQIERDKKSLKSQVNLQDTLLDTMQQYYKDQWNLQKTDLEKKKDALNKEKQMIDERLNYRKNAMNTEEKYREMENLQAQLALIQNDPTRNKDAKELRKKISDIQKELSWQAAEEEAKAQQEALDDQIKAIDDTISYNNENLEEFLKDSHNFTEDLNSIMETGYEGIVDYLSRYNEKFINATDEAREEMMQGWKDTFDDWVQYVETYWDRVNEVLSDQNTFMEFMHNTPDYQNASDTGQAIKDKDYVNAYEDYENANLTSEEALNYALHDHDQAIGEDVADAIAEVIADLDIGEVAEEISTSFDTFDNVTDEFTTAVRGLADAVALFLSTDEARNELFVDFQESFEREKELYDGRTDLLNAFDAFYHEISDADSGFEAQVGNTMSMILDSIINADNALVPTISENIIGSSGMVAQIVDAFLGGEGIVPGIKETNEAIRNAMLDQDGGAIPGFKDMTNKVTLEWTGPDGVTQKMHGTLDAIVVGFEGLDEEIKTDFDNIKISYIGPDGLIHTIGENIGDVNNENSLLGKVSGSFSSLVTDLLTNIGTKDEKGSLLGILASNTKNILDNFGTDTKNTLEDLVKGIITNPDAIIPKAEIMVANAEKKANEIAKTIIGENGEGGLAASVKNAFEGAAGSITSSTGKLDEAIKNLDKSATALTTSGSDLSDAARQLGTIASSIASAATTFTTALLQYSQGTDGDQGIGSAAYYDPSTGNSTGDDELTEYIKELYRQYLGREADAAGLSAWLSIGDKNAILEGIKNSPEALARAGAGTSNGGTDDGATNPSDNTLRYGFTTTDKNGYPRSEGGTVWATNSTDAQNKAKKQISQKWPNLILGSIYRYAQGGLADYTGPAWVDGTKLKPEAFLNPEQTELIGMLAESLKYVSVMPHMSIPGNMTTNSNTIGDINITINQAELKSDADYEDVARRVGKAFTKQLSKEGFNLTNYAF